MGWASRDYGLEKLQPSLKYTSLPHNQASDIRLYFNPYISHQKSVTLYDFKIINWNSKAWTGLLKRFIALFWCAWQLWLLLISSIVLSYCSFFSYIFFMNKCWVIACRLKQAGFLYKQSITMSFDKSCDVKAFFPSLITSYCVDRYLYLLCFGTKPLGTSGMWAA